MTREDNKCDICKGIGEFLDEECHYCNGTGEYNTPAEGYLKYHICQCIHFDRLNCPVCGKSCHHDTPLGPKQKIDPGYRGKPRPKMKKPVVKEEKPIEVK